MADGQFLDAARVNDLPHRSSRRVEQWGVAGFEFTGPSGGTQKFGYFYYQLAGVQMFEPGKKPGTVQVTVLPPIDVSAWPADQIRAKTAEVQAMFADTLAHWPGGPQPPVRKWVCTSSLISARSRRGTGSWP